MAYLRQKPTFSSTTIVNNSRRPISIINARTHFAPSGIMAYVCIFTTSPPSPALLMHENAVMKASDRDVPNSVMTKDPKIMITIYSIMNAIVLLTSSGVTVFPLYVKGTIEFG